MPSRSEVVARFVRTVATSWRIVSTAFFMRSSELLTLGSILDLHEDAGTHGFAAQRAGEIPGHGDVEHDDRKPVVHAHGEGGHVHDLEPAVDGFGIAQGIVSDGGGIPHGI